ncbi:glycoside hydrolase family 108 protein [Mariniblastus fucicola]|uniref:Putative Peptidoglycan domain protein n=1 Tax=Mariniblastus fucicola TaxID=980251 RepID=A0A5B9PNC7_9BACT|nr:glycosyl hydrolase 108 family protein [Mariniblastus fucicola]QEG24041.1 putative Peptidoglycan domain protein [Mariniblastus fucicola]
MADFEIAYGETEIREGGYVHDPVDKGGETHRGVARKFNGDWAGWPIIDQIKKDHPVDFKQRINDSEELAELAKELFRERYWNPIRGDEIPDQHVANKVFDTGVNQGVARSVKYLQEGLNLLNRDQKNYADIQVDGKLGDATLATLKKFLRLEDDQPDYLLKVMNLLQASFYVDIMRRDTTQQRFARGWLNRVDLQ